MPHNRIDRRFMFILHSSNKTENLVAHLATVLEHSPLGSPFSQELFLIQSQGMERWLSQQLARRFQLWANYLFLFPSKFYRFIAQQIDSQVDDSPFDRSLILWRLEGLLRRIEHEDLLPLQAYLSGSNQNVKRYQLAQQLAQTFDQYQIMRPDLLSAWQDGRLLYGSTTERWQQTLWRQLIQLTGSPHRGALWLEVIARLKSAESDAYAGHLPERISVFGINTMPPLFLDYLQSLSRHCDIHLYLLNPAQTYWADPAGKRPIANEGERNGHPLLARLGQQGREFQALLLEFGQFDFEPESFHQIDNPNTLQQLQNDILNNALSGRPMTRDGSISIHACHSRKREVEILRDQLLYALENDADLELSDIAVMAPDIDLYEPFIAAVFHDIQHAVADRSLRLENHSIDTFIRFLELSRSRLGWQTVLDLLEDPAVYPNFNLTTADLELVNLWVQDTHVRWGESGAHKGELGLPETDEFTWRNALDRLLMGYAAGHDDVFIDRILPFKAIEGSSAEAVGGLHDFLQLLFEARAEFSHAKTLNEWGARLYSYAEMLLGQSAPSDGRPERQQLNELLLELSDTFSNVHNDPVDLPVIIYWLEGMMAERKSAHGFLRGQLTFCSMLPMRSIPFKVIALLGINEGEFPKIDRKPIFDLISHHYRPGDRSRRADDRYQFLEILLSARQQLIITYIGQSQTNNEVIPPSVVVTELLEVLQAYYGQEPPVTHHPLQPFSKRYFDGNSALFSFSTADCETAKALSAQKPIPRLWWQGVIETVGDTTEDVIEMNDLLRFFQHPQRYFMRRQLNLELSAFSAETEEREPFAISELNLYNLRQDWLQHVVSGRDFPLSKLQAKELWPAGATGELAFEDNVQALSAFAETVGACGLGRPVDDRTIDLATGRYRLIGTLGNLYENGVLLYRYANLKGKDFITAWLQHLIVNRLEPQHTHLIGIDDRLRFPAELVQDFYLPEFIEIYRTGRQRPDAFFAEAAFAYLKQAANTKAVKSPLAAAIDDLAESTAYESECELRQLYGNVADFGQIIGTAFVAQCERLLLPAWLAAHDI